MMINKKCQNIKENLIFNYSTQLAYNLFYEKNLNKLNQNKFIYY